MFSTRPANRQRCHKRHQAIRWRGPSHRGNFCVTFLMRQCARHANGRSRQVNSVSNPPRSPQPETRHDRPGSNLVEPGHDSSIASRRGSPPRTSSSRPNPSLTWFDIGEPLLIHSQPNQIPNRRYGVCTVLIPALGTRLVRNDIEAKGQSWPREREGRPFSTSALAFSESWTDAL